jgi:hypothetical protein
MRHILSFLCLSAGAAPDGQDGGGLGLDQDPPSLILIQNHGGKELVLV